MTSKVLMIVSASALALAACGQRDNEAGDDVNGAQWPPSRRLRLSAHPRFRIQSGTQVPTGAPWSYRAPPIRLAVRPGWRDRREVCLVLETWPEAKR